MDYNKKYNLKKGIRWLKNRIKQEKCLIKKNKRDLQGHGLSLIRVSIMENILNQFKEVKK